MKKERGAAQLTLTLSDSVITITDSNGVVVNTWEAYRGDWVRLHDTIMATLSLRKTTDYVKYLEETGAKS